jgi:hypothetical protein
MRPIENLLSSITAFRLFLVTRHPEPYLPPDARSLVAATNFTVTRSGLEGELFWAAIVLQMNRLRGWPCFCYADFSRTTL